MASLIARLVRFVSVKTMLTLGFLGVAVLCGVLVAALAIPSIATIAYGTKRAATGIETAPEELKPPSFQGFSHIYDRNGKLLATFYERNQVPVKLAQVAPIMRTAMVDIEDERFYQHGAADAKGILRAFVENQSSGETVAGGSTLTQQYVKNVLQSTAKTPEEIAAATAPTQERKIRELRYAIGVESRMSKDQILEGYLNVATFGRSLYGVEAAAQKYFAVPASRLNVQQAAMIAGMAQSPSALDPTRDANGYVDPARDALLRRNVVLDKMYSLKHLTQTQWTTARKSPLGVVNGGKGVIPDNGCVSAPSAAWYCDYAQQVILRSPEFRVLGATPSERYKRLKAGGLTIKTALDPAIQKITDDGIKKQAYPTDSLIASTAVVRPGTGEVLAVSNSKAFYPDGGGPTGTIAQNYAVEGTYSGVDGFQPGSGMKPFVAAAALMDGLTLDKKLAAPDHLNAFEPFEVCPPGRPVTERYQVRGGRGGKEITMNEALQESVNTYFVQLEGLIGICDPWKLATAAGISQYRGGKQVPFNQFKAFTLGADLTSPLQMSTAYATLGARGVYCKPVVVTSIAVDGREIYKGSPQCKRIIPEGVADAVVSALYHNVQGDQGFNGTARKLKIPGVPFAAKTGTAQEGRSVFFNGFNDQFASSLGVRFVGEYKSVNGESLGGKKIVDATGAGVAGVVWSSYMKPLLQAQSEHPGFADAPPEYGGGGGGFITDPTEDVTDAVPDVSGKTAGDAVRILEAAGFTAIKGTSGKYADDGTRKGRVIRTSPEAGSRSRDGRVYYYLATGKGDDNPEPEPSPTSDPPTPPAQPTPQPTRPIFR